MKKLFKLLLIFIPAYILATLLYTFMYEPHKTEYNQSILSTITEAFTKGENKPAEAKPRPKEEVAPLDKQKDSANRPVKGKLTISMLSINHGDAILLQDEKQNILIDTGHSANRALVLKKLEQRKLKRINTIILTHHHNDHMGNVLKLAGMYGVSRIYDNGLINPDKPFSVKLGEMLSKGNYNNRRLKAGDRLNFGDGFYMDVLSPGDHLEPALRTHLNNNSIVMKLHYGSFTMMLTADIENETEAILASKYGSALKSDVLKVAHHGSKTSSNYRFISEVKPKYALISCGDYATYHHPNVKVVGRLQHLGAEVYNTYDNGDLVITTDGRDFSLTMDKK